MLLNQPLQGMEGAVSRGALLLPMLHCSLAQHSWEHRGQGAELRCP